MASAPRFDHPDMFDARRVRFADIDGSGTADIVYLGRDGAAIHANQAGNAFADADGQPADHHAHDGGSGQGDERGAEPELHWPIRR